MYRHALPPGFVLKSEKKAAEELAKKDVISLEEFLEVEVGVKCYKDLLPLPIHLDGFYTVHTVIR
jgi:hypothetical protein